jgi:hypothetical protein
LRRNPFFLAAAGYFVGILLLSIPVRADHEEEEQGAAKPQGRPLNVEPEKVTQMSVLASQKWGELLKTELRTPNELKPDDYPLQVCMGKLQKVIESPFYSETQLTEAMWFRRNLTDRALRQVAADPAGYDLKNTAIRDVFAEISEAASQPDLKDLLQQAYPPPDPNRGTLPQNDFHIRVAKEELLLRDTPENHAQLLKAIRDFQEEDKRLLAKNQPPRWKGLMDRIQSNTGDRYKQFANMFSFVSAVINKKGAGQLATKIEDIEAEALAQKYPPDRAKMLARILHDAQENYHFVDPESPAALVHREVANRSVTQRGGNLRSGPITQDDLRRMSSLTPAVNINNYNRRRTKAAPSHLKETREKFSRIAEPSNANDYIKDCRESTKGQSVTVRPGLALDPDCPGIGQTTAEYELRNVAAGRPWPPAKQKGKETTFQDDPTSAEFESGPPEVQMRTTLYFAYDPDASEPVRAALRQVNERLVTCTEDFMKSTLGVNATIEVEHDPPGLDQSDPFFFSEAKFGRSSADHLYLAPFLPLLFANQAAFCAAGTFFVHEVMHRLGLPDGYREDNCPDRPEAPPVQFPDLAHGKTYIPNLMVWSNDPRSRLHPKDVQTIFGPLCGDKKQDI